LIHYDHEEQPASSRTLRSEAVVLNEDVHETNNLTSFSSGYIPASVPAPTPLVPSVIVKPLAAKPEQDTEPHTQPISQSNTSGATTTESDEGRHRNHPLYSEGPQPDGLYHCPFKSDPSCQHRPTKLKCNYEYDFITPSASSFEKQKLTVLAM